MHEYVPNLRDIGGIRAGNGAVVKANMVLRSAMPMASDLVHPPIVWPPRLVIDLRSPGEFAGDHPLLVRGSRIVNVPLLSALRPDQAPAQDLAGLYRVMIDHAAALLLDLVREVSRADGPTLIHCAAGKDRTGVSIALLLRLLGVDRDQVVGDYLASTAAEAAIAMRLTQLPGRKQRPPLPKSFLAVPVEAIEGVLDVWDAHEGGTQGWLTAAGADTQLVPRLQEALLD